MSDFLKHYVKKIPPKSNDNQPKICLFITINNYFTGTVKGNYLNEGSRVQIGQGNPRLKNFFNRPSDVVVGNFINCVVLYPQYIL